MKLLEMLRHPFSNANDKKFNDPEDEIKTPVLPNVEDPEAVDLDLNTMTYTMDLDVKFKTVKEAILNYRELASNFEIEDAIDEIVYSAIVDDGDEIVAISLDPINKSDLPESTKKKIKSEFDNILSLLKFRENASKYFRRWYIDGRFWAQIIQTGKEIIKINPLSPLDITRVKVDGKPIYIYKQDEQNKYKQGYFNRKNTEFDEGVEIPEKDIIFVPSGITDTTNTYYISHLHKAIKPFNQLRLLEDSAVIYRITRAPERRVFYIDVGKLQKAKAEQYVSKLMNRFKSSVVYDSKTGKVTQRRNVMTMLEDFYLPSRGDSKGTKVDTLQGGAQLGEIDDILYFKKKLLKSLKVPVSRFDDENQPVVDLGKSGELTRNELKFSRFINHLRREFSKIFVELLRTQLILKNILKVHEWNVIKDDISFVWSSDSYFAELKETEVLSNRLDLLSNMSEYIGKYYSHAWVRKNVLKQTDDDIEENDKQIEDEKKSGIIDDGEEQDQGQGF